MSSRMSSSSGDAFPLGRDGVRTPFRSLENEAMPTQWSKPKPVLGADVNLMKGNMALSDPESFLTNKEIPTSANTDLKNAEMAFECGDVTYKSFISAGGEVEIRDFSLLAEASLMLPLDQGMNNTCEAEDVDNSGCMIDQSCCADHVDHPYHNPEMKDALLVADKASEISSSPKDLGKLKDESATEDFAHVTWKSLVCDGGGVQILDMTTILDEIVPKPHLLFSPHLERSSLNTANLSVLNQQYEVEPVDHPYCGTTHDAVPSSSSANESVFEERSRRVNDITYKSFNCTGGEIQISDVATLESETVPLPAGQTSACSESCIYGVDPSISTTVQDVHNLSEHLDHPYCNIEADPSPLIDSCVLTHQTLPDVPDAPEEAYRNSPDLSGDLTKNPACVKSVPLKSSGNETEESDDILFTQKGSARLEDQVLIVPGLDYNILNTANKKDQNGENSDGLSNKNTDVFDPEPSELSEPSQPHKSCKHSVHKSCSSPMLEKDTVLYPSHPEAESSGCSQDAASEGSSMPVEENQKYISEEHVDIGPQQTSEAKDSAIGASANAAGLCSSAEKPEAEIISDVLKVLSECPSVASALQLGQLSPVVRRASVFLLEAKNAPSVDQFLTDDSALEADKSLLANVNVNPAGLWAEQLMSPMPHPLLNSTAVAGQCQPSLVTEPVQKVAQKPQVQNPVVDAPLIPDGPLQQQLRQMAEFLLLASGKINLGPGSATAPLPPPTISVVPKTQATPVGSHSICVGTSPVKYKEHSVNTSGQFERKRDFSVVDTCTLTDPLLWNVPPGSLEGLPREELEQRLRSSMIMVEALVQQLATARASVCPAGPAPSDLREKLVQTDHTELSQTTMHRDLYLEALRRIGELELDGRSLQNLTVCMEDMKVTMTSLTCDTEAALTSMKQIEDVSREDHQNLVTHYGQMRSVFERTKQVHMAMMEKAKGVLQQRDDMRMQMEEAFRAKEAAFGVMEQLRTHCAKEIFELERNLGSQQELSAALDQTHPELVALNQDYNDTLNSASDVLSETMKEQAGLTEELCRVRGLLQKAVPMLQQLNEKAAAALKERDECTLARDQAVEDREQMEDELNQTNLSLQSAREQIGDLNLQVTILTSEMGVLRQKLNEREEERGQLERKATELSATVSSTLASYAFLEQALAAETTKLQQSWKDIQEAKERANELETSLVQSEQRVCELSGALAQREEQLGQLQTLWQSQNTEIQQLHDVCTQLSGVREMNEFLQMENELAREQMSESERVLRANLQGLRERNFECEDLKGELTQLKLHNTRLQAELDTTKSRAAAAELKLVEKLEQAGTEITLLHHTLRGLTDELHAALNEQGAESLRGKDTEGPHSSGRRHPSSSFVDRVMVALTVEEEDRNTSPAEATGSSDLPEPPLGALFSEMSAFTRITAVTPKKHVNSPREFEPEEDEQSSLTELFTGLDGTVTELISTLKLVRQRKDAELEELRSTIRGLQVEHEAANSRQQAEVVELRHQLNRLNSLVERGNQALQQKTQDEKTIGRLMSDIQETQEILSKHKAESNEVRKDVVELRRLLQQAQVECQFLRGELKKAGGQLVLPAHFMEEKLQLLKEVERLKSNLQEAEQARVKLLERAKRHQIIHQTNQQKSENELQLLNSILNKVREALLSLPDVVKNSETLQQLVEYLG
eukprot:XP_011611216.1 PREDICTED: uncharacterized protein LOC105417693 [Takifugu rubripes]